MSRWLLGTVLLIPLAAVAQENLGVALEQSGTVTTAEKAAFAQLAVEEIAEIVAAVADMKAEAEKKKDAAGVECLEPKVEALAKLDPAAQDTAKNLANAASDADVVGVDQQYRLLLSGLTKARDFLTEAKACVGDTGGKAGSTNNTLDPNQSGAPNLMDPPSMVIEASPG